MVKKDMALEASLFKNNDFLKFVIEKWKLVHFNSLRTNL
jgi:hypothetical protein